MSATTDERTPDSGPEQEARPEDERLPFLSSLGYGVQHILAMFGGVIAVRPDLVLSLGTSAAGTATLPLPVPNVLALVNQSLFTQVAVGDAAAVQGIALTAAARLQVCAQP